MKFLLRGLAALPSSLALNVAAGIGTLMYWLDAKHRRVALNNLAIVFPVRPPAERKRIARLHFQHLAKVAVEFAWLGSSRKRERFRTSVTIQGLEEHEAARKKGKGVVMIVPHFGNWELLGAVYPIFADSAAIAFPQSNPLTNALIDGVRKSCGLEVIQTGVSVRRVLKALKRGATVGFLADQHVHDGVTVDFFGRPTIFPAGPVAIALKTGAPMLMSYMVRHADDRHTLVIEPEMKLTGEASQQERFRVNTQRWVRRMEELIRRHPPLWFWVHNRWKS